MNFSSQGIWEAIFFSGTLLNPFFVSSLWILLAAAGRCGTTWCACHHRWLLRLEVALQKVCLKLQPLRQSVCGEHLLLLALGCGQQVRQLERK